MSWRRTLRDDRGRTAPVYTAKDRASSPESRADFPPEQFARVRARMRRENPAGELGEQLAFGCLFVYVAIALLMAIPRLLLGFEWLDLARLAFWLVVLGLACRAMRYAFGSIHPPTIRTAMLAERRCPSCGYDLAGATPEPDGCALCAECGAAWRTSEPAAAQTPRSG